MVKFTYSTDKERIYKLKCLALKYGVNSRDILDIVFDDFINRLGENDEYFYHLLDFYKGVK